MFARGPVAQQSRDFTSSGFEAGTPVGDYVTRKNLSLDDAALQTPRCERHARAQADKCNFENLEQADDECHLDESECGKSVVKYFCEFWWCAARASDGRCTASLDYTAVL